MLTVLMAGQEHFLAWISLFLVVKLSPLVAVGSLQMLTQIGGVQRSLASARQ